jgi:hypothetical protein
MLVEDTGDPDDIEDEPTAPRTHSFNWLPQSWGALDTWGDVLGCPRNPNEDDANYRQRLLDHLGKP